MLDLNSQYRFSLIVAYCLLKNVSVTFSKNFQTHLQENHSSVSILTARFFGVLDFTTLKNGNNSIEALLPLLNFSSYKITREASHAEVTQVTAMKRNDT